MRPRGDGACGELTPRAGVGYARRQRQGKGGSIGYRAVFIAIFTLLTGIRTYYRIATGALRERFGGAWLAYREATGAFLPRLGLGPIRPARRARAAAAGGGR